MLAAGAELGFQLHARVRAVRCDDEQAGVSTPEQLVVEALTVDDDVGEPAPVDVSGFDVALEAHDATSEPACGVRRGLGSEALDGLRRVMGLGCVDAEQPDRVRRAVGESDDDGVTVDRL